MRIVSLLASATEIVCALDLEDQLVAISHECDFPPTALSRPRVSRPRFDVNGRSSGDIDRLVRHAMVEYGSVYVLDEDRLRSLQPDLILSQAVCEVCAVPTTLAEQAAATLDARIVSLDAHSIDEILESIRVVGAAAGVPDRAESVIAQLQRRLDAVQRTTADRPTVRVLALEWLDPPFIPGHWTPEMVRLAGGELLGATTHMPSRQVEWSEIESQDPDVVLVMPCGFDLAAATVDADRHAAQLTAVAPRALAAGRVYAADGSAYFNRSGPRMVDGVELLGALLHPAAFSGYHATEKAQRWQPPE